MIIGEERPEKKMQQNKTSRDASMLGGQDKKKANNKSTSLTGAKIGLTGASNESGSSFKSKTWPSFKELLAKYEKQGTVQKKEKQSGEAKDVSSSSKLQEQSVCCSHQSNGPFTPWFHPYFYMPMDYSRMHMQSYYIQYPPIYPSYASPQRPIVASNNLVKKDFSCSKKDMKQDSRYSQPRWCPSGLSHTQKRKLQRLRKQESVEQQMEVKPITSVVTKKVWRPKQVVSA